MASSHLYRALMGGTALALIAGSSGQVAAQSAQQIEGASSVLQEIVVFGGARDERALLETPNAASVIGADELRRRSASTYEELLGDTTGLIITGGPRGISQEPNIRGFSDEQVVIRTDGVRQNFNLAHRGRFFTDPSIL
ncbi:MAG: TonB-dependent receptor plug domain-containing protein, partial [Pseudomonadota bacterium]